MSRRMTHTGSCVREHNEKIAMIADLFLSAIIIAFQSERGRTGFAEDLRWAAGLCRTTWAEEQLWDGLVNVQRGRQKRTHLMYASMKGDVERVRWLLARGAPMELKDNYGHTALYLAAICNRAEVARVLIAAGADVEATDNFGFTPLYIASTFGCADVLEVLFAAGADVNTARSQTVFGNRNGNPFRLRR